MMKKYIILFLLANFGGLTAMDMTQAQRRRVVATALQCTHLSCGHQSPSKSALTVHIENILVNVLMNVRMKVVLMLPNKKVI